MDPDVAAHAFEPFFTTKEVGKGTGLGLSQVYGFIKQSGGHVDDRHEPGVGTTFRLYLPRCHDSASGARCRGQVRRRPPPTGHETVLVVEDNAEVLELAVTTISDLGYRVLTAADGPSALEVVRGDEPIDLLFSDVVMPGGMNGFELISQARCHPRRAEGAGDVRLCQRPSAGHRTPGRAVAAEAISPQRPGALHPDGTGPRLSPGIVTRAQRHGRRGRQHDFSASASISAARSPTSWRSPRTGAWSPTRSPPRRTITATASSTDCARCWRRHADVTEVLHGTTIGSNTILEGKGARTALITTKGFRDILEIRDLRMPVLYDLHWTKPRALVERRLRLEVVEKLRPDGSVAVPLDAASVAAAIDMLRREEVQSVAICLLHSYANPAHERAVAEAVRAALPDVAISVSHEILPEIKEYPRTSTTVINAYVQPVVRAYVTALAARLRALGIAAPLQLMQSNGGLASAEFAADRAGAYHRKRPGGRRGRRRSAGGQARRAARHHLRHGRHHREGRPGREWRGAAQRGARSRRRRHGRIAPAGRRGLYAEAAGDRSGRGGRRRRLDLPAGCAAVRRRSDRTAPAPNRDRCATAAAAPSRRSPTATWCSAISIRPAWWAAR